MATKLINEMERVPIRALSGETRTEAVLYVEQELTAIQRAQARKNIKVASISEVAYLGSPITSV